MEEVLEPFCKGFPGGGDHVEGAFAGVEHEEVLRYSWELKGVTRCNLKMRILARSLLLF